MKELKIIAAAACFSITLHGSSILAATKNITVNGLVTRYGTSSPTDEVSVGTGFSVAVTVTQYVQTGTTFNKTCTPSTTTVTATTDTGGAYSIPLTINAGQCKEGKYLDPRRGWLWGKPWPEVEIAVGPRSTDSNVAALSLSTATPGGSYAIDLRRTAEFSYQGLWARRIGKGTKPIFFLEGFDPGDTIKVSAAACPAGAPITSCAGVSELLYASPLPANLGQNFGTHIQNNNYSFWIISTGAVSGQSMHDTGGGDTSGLVYRAMKLIKTIYDAKHSGARFAIGGFSMGGLMAQIGTGKWCDGAWSGAGLPAGCANLDLVFYGDAPRGDGALIPLALQAYLRHLAPEQADSLDYPSAGELIAKWIPPSRNYTDGSGDQCETQCKSLGGFIGGCDSTDGSFMKNGCLTDANPRASMLTWAGPYAGSAAIGPKRNGVPIATVAWSHGRKPGGLGNDCPSAWSTPLFWDTNVATNVLNIHVHHRIYLNSGPNWGWVDECQAGSVYPFRETYDGQSTAADNMTASFSVLFNPTFIPSASALVNSSLLNDYWYEVAANKSHVPYSGLPAQATRMLVAYLSEFLHGRREKPVCDAGSTTGFGWKQQDEGVPTCRQPSPETCNGFDDDGDNLVDELLDCPVELEHKPRPVFP